MLGSIRIADYEKMMQRRHFITVLGCAAIWPFAVTAQQKPSRVIGFLGARALAESTHLLAAFKQGLSEAGYVEGQNVIIEYRWANGDYDRLPALAADLVSRKVDVIVAQSNVSARAAQSATSTIPIVFTGGGDPVAAGLISSLSRPGGNLTGLSFLTVDLMAKRLELLAELVPEAKKIALLLNPRIIAAEQVIRDVQEAAHAKGVTLHVLTVATDAEIDAAFASIVELRAGALVIGSDPFFASRRDRLFALAARQGVPAIYDQRETAAAGGLISYGADTNAIYLRVGVYAARILKGANPADLPVEQASKFELVINLKTANALGLTVPQSLLARADEVIE